MSKKKIIIEEKNQNTNCSVDLEKEYTDSCGMDETSNECNKFLLKKELVERKCLSNEDENKPYLYPNLNDPNFIIKIAEKKEFNDTKYDGTIRPNIKEYADILANAEFEVQPHQAFVKNFMSFQTPYNSLLLYHGLGSGKTCSAIGVCEEMRDYLRQMDINKQIIIVASSNVQDNFRLQLFDERKLKLVNGIWTIKGCLGNKMLKEINPTSMKNIPKEKIISQIKTLINHYYLFLGYGEFANYIIRTMYQGIERDLGEQGKKKQPVYESNVKLTKKMINNLRNVFDDRLVVIDEIHNIRNTDDNSDKRVAIQLEYLVQATKNMRFLFLSATPMYNSYKEIIWLLNLMNMNDNRGKIDIKDVFDKYGDFKKDGEELLTRKATGYISFVRGENPYMFPFRVYPNEFAPKDTFPYKEYPKYQMNGQPINDSDKDRIISLYLTTIGNCKTCGECQYCAYRYIISNLKNRPTQITTKKGQIREMPSFENMESFGYSLLQTPLESLIISYPMEGLKEILEELPEQEPDKGGKKKKQEEEKESDNGSVVEEDENDDSLSSPGTLYRIPSNELTGKNGLKRVMQFVDTKSPPKKGAFKYRSEIIQKYGKIFNYDLIGKYSSKIKSILDSVYNPETGRVSDGVILIYSQYIDGGLIPAALALEELGFTRYGKDAQNLFEDPPTEVVDVNTMKPPTNKKNFMPARYSMITGDVRISPDNDFEVKGLTDEKNKDGNLVKVVLISKAGSEGIDLKFIRQVHILDPWYNMNRLEQIIGRAVRNLSHKDLPFEKRNVQIFMYGTLLENNKEESADLYVYRVAEYKAIQIGKVSRLLKETAVDCILNYDQTNFTYENMKNQLNEDITQELSTGTTLSQFKVGDLDYTAACDYMQCEYSCRPTKEITEKDTNLGTYSEAFVYMNAEKISQRIRMLMKEGYFYKRDIFVKMIQTPKEYPEIQIYAVLSQMIEDENEIIEDRYGRMGHLVNIGEFYLFQPLELTDKNVSIYDRSVPIDYKHNKITIELQKPQGKVPLVEAEGEKEVLAFEIPFIEDLKRDYNLAIEFFKETKVPRGDDNWYKHCGIVMNKMAVEEKINLQDLVEFLIDHILDLLLYKEKVELMNYLYSLKRINEGTFEWNAKQYFTRNSMENQGITGYILYDLGEMKVIKLIGNKWIEAEYTDVNKLLKLPELEKPLDKSQYGNIVGFLGYEKHYKYLVFKTKDMSAPRDTGARCDEAGKTKTLTVLNSILGEQKYTKENTKIQKDESGKNVIKEAIGLQELCVIEEFTLRYYNKTRKDGKKYFFTPEMAIYFELYKIYAK